MTEKKKSVKTGSKTGNSKNGSKTSKLKNFLATGIIEEEEQKMSEDEVVREEPASIEIVIEEAPQEDVEVVIEDIIVTEEVLVEDIAAEPEDVPETIPVKDPSRLENEISELRGMIASLASDLEKYTTSKEQLKEYSSVMKKRDAEIANKKFMGMLEQLSVMREDFFKLCSGMNAKLDSFSPKDILSSFEAYGVDLENILTDCGVQIGPSKYEKLNTIHQRIVDVIPTGDESMNGMIAERMSDGYEYQGRVLLKERVKIYKFSENGKTEGDEEK